MALTEEQISIAKGMLARGDRQSDIAAFFQINSGRIAELATGERGLEITVAPSHKLPPPGPYVPFPAELAEHLEDLYASLSDVIDILRQHKNLMSPDA